MIRGSKLKASFLCQPQMHAFTGFFCLLREYRATVLTAVLQENVYPATHAVALYLQRECPHVRRVFVMGSLALEASIQQVCAGRVEIFSARDVPEISSDADFAGLSAPMDIGAVSCLASI